MRVKEKVGAGLLFAGLTASTVTGCSEKGNAMPETLTTTTIASSTGESEGRLPDYANPDVHILYDNYDNPVSGCLAEVSRTAIWSVVREESNKVKENTYYVNGNGQEGGVAITEAENLGNGWRYSFNLYPQQANEGDLYRLTGWMELPSDGKQDPLSTLYGADFKDFTGVNDMDPDTYLTIIDSGRGDYGIRAGVTEDYEEYARDHVCPSADTLKSVIVKNLPS